MTLSTKVHHPLKFLTISKYSRSSLASVREPPETYSWPRTEAPFFIQVDPSMHTVPLPITISSFYPGHNHCGRHATYAVNIDGKIKVSRSATGKGLHRGILPHRSKLSWAKPFRPRGVLNDIDNFSCLFCRWSRLGSEHNHRYILHSFYDVCKLLQVIDV